MNSIKTSAILLAAGSGRRMGGSVKKQFMLLKDKPLLYYPMKVFEESFIDEIIVVCSPDDESFIRDEIISAYGLKKVVKMVPGGKERYDSVLCGLNAIDECDYVFIHDGARPFADEEILKRAYETVEKYGTAIVSMPVKDTIKVVDDNGFTLDTPDRSHVWLMQTPQVFGYREILEAYERMDSYMKKNANDSSNLNITDDAMVMEHFGSLQVHVSEGSYRNIKITTPEDMIVAQALLKQGI